MYDVADWILLIGAGFLCAEHTQESVQVSTSSSRHFVHNVVCAGVDYVYNPRMIHLLVTCV